MTDPVQLAAAVQTDAAQSEETHDSARRVALADAARRDAEACMSAAPQLAGCNYARALALGLVARAYPASANTSLKDMLASLARAEHIDANYDAAGPARLRALVLARAPGWPLGPGDPDEAGEAAQRAVALHPEYPPNWLALAETQHRSGDAGKMAAAKVSYAHARDAALALPESPQRTQWLSAARAGLTDQTTREPTR